MALKIIQKILEVETKGSGDLVNITTDILKILKETNLKTGNLLVFVVGSTAGITTFEYEPALIKDVRDFYERVAPANKHYEHDRTWGDANGFSHIRASIVGPSLTVPFEDAKLVLGTWQQVVLAEFDIRSRRRRIVIQITGE